VTKRWKEQILELVTKQARSLMRAAADDDEDEEHNNLMRMIRHEKYPR
jgi:hypothetical protein